MRFLSKVLILAVVLVGSALRAEAAPILGIPVASFSSVTQVGLPLVTHDPTPDGTANGTPGWVRYYIPLRQSTSGVYGVTDTNGANPCEATGVDCAGTFSDTGSGNSWLNMYLMFTPVAAQPLDNARLHFEFSDLDLRYVNDPAGFLETVRVYGRNGDAISPRFTQATGSGESGAFNGINYELSRTPGSAGRNWPVYLDLWGDGLEELITDPFWVALRFTIPSVPYGRNTAEFLRATLDAESLQPPSPPAIPEPASLVLLATGLAISARSLRRRPSTK